MTDATISFGQLAATRKSCAEAVMRQEQQYLDALGNANRFEIKGSLLYIHATGRAQPLRFVRDDVSEGAACLTFDQCDRCP